MKLEKALNRDRKIHKRCYGMQEDGRSVKYLNDLARKKALDIKRQQELKEALSEVTFNIYEAVDNE